MSRPFRRVPSLATLRRVYDDETARRLRRILDGREDPCTVDQTDAWRRSCYHPPSRRELIRHACDVIAGGYGLEAIRDRDGDCVAEYVNTGDTYAATLMFPRGRSPYVSDVGTFVETYERRHGRLP